MDRMITMPTQGDVIPRSPTTQLRLYSGVPWDNEYKHVRLYRSQSELLSHLEQWRVSVPSSLNSMAPIRVGELDVKVPFTEMDALDLNYLAFNNTGLLNKWVFCFITRIEWRSEKTTRIHFELDVFQNNWYSVTMKPCFIEYSHIPKSQDVVGSNQCPVNLETGESVVAKSYTYPLYDMEICVYATEGTTGKAFDGSVTNGIYRTGSLGHYGTDEVDTVNGLINAYNEQGMVDSILALFMAPQLCVNAIKKDGTNKDNFSVPLDTSHVFGGYKPKNNKLYSYPFVYLMVDNNEGQANVYRFELSNNSDHTIDFELTGAMCTLPQVMLTPLHYKSAGKLNSENMVISGFPQCAYQSDTFRAWVAQNKGALAVQSASIAVDALSAPFNAVSGAIGGGIMGGTGGAIVGGVSSSVTSMTSPIMSTLSLLGQLRDKSIIPPTVHGKALSENINVACGLTGYSFYVMSCQREFAERIDSFFSVYGYPINKVQRPNITSRSNWNYLKTSGCGFSGQIDLDQLQQLREICNRGVTFWHTDDVGNYSLSNN